jgi:hypothetical protein
MSSCKICRDGTQIFMIIMICYDKKRKSSFIITNHNNLRSITHRIPNKINQPLKFVIIARERPMEDLLIEQLLQSGAEVLVNLGYISGIRNHVSQLSPIPQI